MPIYPQPTERDEVIAGLTFKPAPRNGTMRWFVFTGTDRTFYASSIQETKDGQYNVFGLGQIKVVDSWDEAVHLLLRRFDFATNTDTADRPQHSGEGT